MGIPSPTVLREWIKLAKIGWKRIEECFRGQSKPPPKAGWKIIKGLWAYGFEDAEAFSHLERHLDLRDCVTSVEHDGFRFGVLTGESGSGKTSFLQAALWPALIEKKHSCVYIKLSDAEPLTSLRQALSEQLNIDYKNIENDEIWRAMVQGAKRDSQPIVVVLDQFEQLFRQRRNDREPFIEAIAELYGVESDPPIKILLSVRGDFVDRIFDLLRRMGCSLGPHEIFRLKRFEPEQAFRVFKTVAEFEGINFEEGFVREFITEELADREEGLISPVDVQMLAWMAAAKSIAEAGGFNRRSFRRLGGVAGLLEQFLRRALDARETDERRQAVVKTLLTLADLDHNTRSGVWTVQELQRELGGTLKKAQVEEAVNWLAREDIRLIRPVKRDRGVGYELGHERIIPALRRIAGRELAEVARANELLGRRVNEWLGNDHDSRFLLRWSEYRLIRRHESNLDWEPHHDKKQELLQRSRRRLQTYASVALTFVVVIAAAAAWWRSPWGQIYRVEGQFSNLVQKIDDNLVMKKIAINFANGGAVSRAQNQVEKLQPSLEKVQALIALVGIVPTGNETLRKARSTAKKVSPDLTRVTAMCRVAEAYARGNKFEKATNVVNECLTWIDEDMEKVTEKVEALNQIMEVCQVYRGAATTNILAQAKKIAGKIEDSSFEIGALSSIAAAYGRADREKDAKGLFEEVSKGIADIEKVSDRIDARCTVAEAWSQLGKIDRAKNELLKCLECEWGKIEDPFAKSHAVSRVANASISLGKSPGATNVLRQAEKNAETIKKKYSKNTARGAVAKAYAEWARRSMKKQSARVALKEARRIGRRIENTAIRENVLRNIVKVYAYAGKSEVVRTNTAKEYLEKAVEINDGFDLHLMSISDVTDIPGSGQSSVFVARLGRGNRLHVRIFDASGKILTDKGETDFPQKNKEIGNLKKLLGKVSDEKGPTCRQKAAVLNAVMKITDITRIGDKIGATAAIAEAYAKRGAAEKKVGWVDRALCEAEKMKEGEAKAGALHAVVKGYANLGRWREARRTVQRLRDDGRKAIALSIILSTWKEG